MFDGYFEEIHFKTPSVVSKGDLSRSFTVRLYGVAWSCDDKKFSQIFQLSSPLPLVQLNVSSYLQLLCLAEDMRTDPSDISSLLRLNGCDIRQSLLQLQFWTRSAGGRHITKAGLKPETDGEATETSVPAALPPCDTGCTESRLGLLNTEPERDIWDLLKVNSSQHITRTSSRFL